MATVASMWVKVGADVRDLKRNLSEGERAAQRFADRMGSVGRKLSVAATLPIVAMGAASLKAASDFEAGLNRVQAVSGATASEFAALKKQAADLGATTQYTAGQAADAMGFLGMAGFRANEILGAMPGTLQLAAAAQIDLARSADIVTNILTGYGLAVEELGMANDVLVRTFTRTNTDLSMLGESFKYVGPVAKSAGVAFTETAAAIGLMGNAGIQGSMAGTSLRGAITRLLKPTAEVSRTLARLGVSATDSEGRLRSLTDIVQQLEEAGATTGDMMAIFGQRAGPAMAALVEQGSEALRNLVQELEASGGTAQRIAETQMKGLRGALRELKSAVEALALAITGTGLSTAVEGLARRLASLTRAVAGLPRPLLLIGTISAGLVAALGPLLLIGAKITTMLLTLKAAAAAAGIAIGTIAAPVAAVVAALGALGIGLGVAMTRAQRARDAQREFAEAAREAARIQAQSPEGRARQIRELEERERHLLSRIAALRRAADVSSERMARTFTRSAAQFRWELIQVQGQLSNLRRGGAEVADSLTGAAEAAGTLRREIDHTWDTWDRLTDIQRRVEDTLADLRIEAALAPGEEALEEILQQIAEMEARLQAVTSEMDRFGRTAARRAAEITAAASPGEMQRSIQRRIPIRAEPIQRASTELERAQSALEHWLADPRITIGMLERDPEFQRFAEALQRDFQRRQEIMEATQPAPDMGALDKLLAGDILGALKAAFVPLLKVAAPLAVAFEVLKGIMDAVSEPLKALLLPLRMLGEVVGRVLVPILRGLWPVIKTVVVAFSYVAEVIFLVAGYIQKGIGWLLEAIGKAVKLLSFGLVKSIERAGKSLQEMGDGSLQAAKDMGELRRELRDMSFEDAMDRVADSANKAADALLNVPQGFKVAWARFQATAPEATVSMPGSPLTSTPAGHTTVQNHVPVTIHVHATERTDVPALVQEIKREFSREAQRGGVTGLELVFGAA